MRVATNEEIENICKEFHRLMGDKAEQEYEDELINSCLFDYKLAFSREEYIANQEAHYILEKLMEGKYRCHDAYINENAPYQILYVFTGTGNTFHLLQIDILNDMYNADIRLAFCTNGLKKLDCRNIKKIYQKVKLKEYEIGNEILENKKFQLSII